MSWALLRQLGFRCRAIDTILERVRRYAEIDHFREFVAVEEADRGAG